MKKNSIGKDLLDSVITIRLIAAALTTKIYLGFEV